MNISSDNHIDSVLKQTNLKKRGDHYGTLEMNVGFFSSLVFMSIYLSTLYFLFFFFPGDSHSSFEPRKIDSLCQKNVVDLAFGSGPHVIAITKGIV